ncbi:hypothetical protein [Rhizobium leguminosarum]|uniref:hypothetical protein n=1 Tax=Rhizobium leguminosarum TaxID=384 RepID=UPI001AE11FA6|nr:hypothetical protein [Rhizobium leguminosarum]MBP2449656.1 hypothetical protein [Rhizobium leguminosarum]
MMARVWKLGLAGFGRSLGVVTECAKLKLIKRQIYGRGKLELLDARIVGTP